jgi:hypothetical protein
MFALTYDQVTTLRVEEAHHWNLSVYAVLTFQTSLSCQLPGSFEALFVFVHFPLLSSITDHLQPIHPSYIGFGD